MVGDHGKATTRHGDSRGIMTDIREMRSSLLGDEDRSETPRLLVAVESLAVRKILSHMLTTLGWQAIEAAGVDQALELSCGVPTPQAVLLDFSVSQAPAMCRAIKSNDRCQLIPIVAITADDSSERKLRALEAGVDDFISQPIHRAELTIRLRSLLRTQKFNQELIGAETVALALARAVAAKDGYAQRHVEEVATYSVMLGKAIGMDIADLKILRYGAILHNVGKIGLPDSILEKTEALTPREMALFQQHPRVGCDICSPLKPLRSVLPIIRHHKERWDGTGYPDGLCGAEIPLGAQIVGIVNSFVAMISDRPYRRAMLQQKAVECLHSATLTGAHDPELVEKFIRCLPAPHSNVIETLTASGQISCAAPVIPDLAPVAG